MYYASGESLCDPHRCQAHPLHRKRRVLLSHLFFHITKWTPRIQPGSGRLKIASTSNQLSRHVSQHLETRGRIRIASHRSSTLTESKTATYHHLRADRVFPRGRGPEREYPQTHVSGQEGNQHSTGDFL